jgi:hypothetical protein
MLKSLSASIVVLVMTASVGSAQQILYQGESGAAAPNRDSAKSVHSGKVEYWTASGPFYVDQQLDAQSRLIFPYNDQQRFLWLSNRMNEQLDRQQGNSYSIRIR